MKRSAPDSPKFSDILRELQIKKYEGIGILESLWHLTAKQAPQGNIGRWSDRQIASALDWDKTTPEELIDALVVTKWLERSEEHRLIVHDWHDHADDSIRKMLKYQDLQFLSRQNGESQRISENLREGSDKSGGSQPKPENIALAGARIARSQSLKPKPEENTDSLEPEIPASQPAQRQPPPAPDPNDPPILIFPTVGPVKFWELRASKLAEWQSTYPTINCEQTAMIALQWCRDNPGKRKTAKGMTRFLGSFFTRETDKTPRSNGNGYHPPQDNRETPETQKDKDYSGWFNNDTNA